MTTEQAERATQTKPTPNADAAGVIDSLAVKTPTRESKESMFDSIMKETVGTESAGEGPVIRVLLTGLNWATYALAAGVVLFLSWAARDVVRQYLGQ
jgi:hypothetical protein